MANTPQNKQRGQNSPPRSRGRPKGSPNKTTAMLKEAVLKAAAAQGQDGKGKQKLVGYCRYLAKEEPKAFAGLLGRVLPLQVTGDGGGPVQFQKIERVVVDSKD